MRRLRAQKIFDGKQIQEDKLLIIDESGTVVFFGDDDGKEAEIFSGLLCPGFINSHCHLELSYLKNKVAPGKGMVDFLIAVVHARKEDHADKLKLISAAENEMWLNGISAVADICNTTDTIEIKANQRISWYNFVEVINFYDSSLEKQLPIYISVRDQFLAAGMKAILSPHAPYSISSLTYAAINEDSNGEIISIHSQESNAENELFLTGDSDFLRLYSEFGDGRSPFAVSGKSSLQTWLPHFTSGQTILLVHNTFITEEDIHFASTHAGKHGMQLVYCICPNANLYIEGCLPPLELLLKKNCRIVIGTDSYSSNYQLSVAAELKTLKNHFPDITLDTMLRWTTSDAAEVFKWDHLGSFEIGKKPGVILLDEKDFSVTRIV